MPITPISHAHIQYGRLLTYYWCHFKTSYISKCPINRKREIINMSPLFYAVGASYLQKTVQRYNYFLICANKNVEKYRKYK